MSYSGYDGGQSGGYDGGYSSYGGYSEASYPHTPQQREGSHTPHSFYDPNLYIPIMAFLTYILVVGYVLGLSSRFSPEVLATTASSSLVWLILEIMVIYLTTTIMSIKTTLAKWDFLAFSMYKYVGMIVSMVAGLLLSTKGYYSALLYSMIALVLFLFRTLHLRVEPEVHGVENHGKRKMWLLFLVAGLQPLLMWWLTYSLVPEPVVIPGPQM